MPDEFCAIEYIITNEQGKDVFEYRDVTDRPEGESNFNEALQRQGLSYMAVNGWNLIGSTGLVNGNGACYHFKRKNPSAEKQTVV